MHLDTPNVPFTGCAVDTIGMLPTTSKGHKFVLTIICLLMSYVITVPLKTKKAEEITMKYLKEILPQTSYSLYILQDNRTEFKSDHLISTFESLGMKQINSNPFYPKGNGRIGNVHNFLKRTIAKFIHKSTLKRDNTLPLATYCFM